MIAHGLLDEVDVVLAQRSEIPQRLRQRPAAVRIEPQARTGAERLAHGRDQLEVLRVAEPDLEVEDLEAGSEAVLDLWLEALRRAAREVVEVRRLLLLKPAEEPPERLAAGAAAESHSAMSIPAQAKLPVPARNCQRPCVKTSRRIASRFHGSRPTTNGVIARSAASTDAVSAPQHASPQPTRPSSVVSLHEHVADAVSRDLGADLTVPVRDADRDRLDGRDLHSVCSNWVRISLSSRADEEDVLEADAAPARAIDRRLEREHHPLLDPHVAVRRDARLLRPRRADAMSCVMLVRRPVLGEQVAHLPVDVLCDDAGPAERDALVQRAADGVEAPARLPVRRRRRRLRSRCRTRRRRSRVTCR